MSGWFPKRAILLCTVMAISQGETIEASTVEIFAVFPAAVEPGSSVELEIRARSNALDDTTNPPDPIGLACV